MASAAMDDGDDGYEFDFEDTVDDAELEATDFLPNDLGAIPSTSAPESDERHKPRSGTGTPENVPTNDAFEASLAVRSLPEGSDASLRVDFKSKYFDPTAALAVRDPPLETPRKVRPLENVRRFRRLLPTNDPLFLDPAAMPARGRGGRLDADSRIAREKAKDAAFAVANAKARAEKFRKQSEAARARAPILETLADENKKNGGPLSVLVRAMEEKRRVRVRTRHASGVRGEAVAYVKAFDRHVNMILVDVVENSTSRIRKFREVQTRDGAVRTRAGWKLEKKTRHLQQVFLRGEQVVLVAVVGDDLSGDFPPGDDPVGMRESRSVGGSVL